MVSRSSRATGVHRISADGILEAFSRLVAARSSDALIIGPGRHATPGEIDGLSREVADLVRATGLPPGSLIGLAAPNGPAFLAGFLAVRHAGHAALLLDPAAPLEDSHRAESSLQAAAVLECSEAWPRSRDRFRVTRQRTVPPVDGMGDLAVVKLTSGSTGVPRGVAMRTEHLLADEEALGTSMGFLATDRLLGAIPFSHSYGFSTLVLSALVRGLPIILPAHRGAFASPAVARTFGATVFPTVPAYIQALMRLSPPPSWPDSVRLVLSAGALLPMESAARFRETYGQQVHVFYGASECGGICYDRDGGAAERGTVGTPVDGVRLSLIPTEGRDDDEGVVSVSSPSVGTTYLPEAEARLSGGRFDTSDVGAWRGGELLLRRRLDRVINVRGRKVDPSEVEGVLATLAGVEEACVLGTSAADGRGEVVRAVVACPSGTPRQQDVAEWCRHRLAEHKVPRSILIVDAIPKTSRGKIDRAALMSLLDAQYQPL